MQGVAVRVGVDSHTPDPRVPAGTGNPNGDLATVRDEHLAHDGSFLGASPQQINVASLGTDDTACRADPGGELAHTERGGGVVEGPKSLDSPG
ncbi:hypothetical protein T261_03261 [Streptomyces lydicus]|nr:hypothetical protein T261_03261 [Streptomyces lydicus]